MVITHQRTGVSTYTVEIFTWREISREIATATLGAIGNATQRAVAGLRAT